MTNLQPAVGRAILRQLSGFKGYPRDEAGETRFVEVLCEASLSVEHAVAVTQAFDGGFPTVKEIRDTAFSLREKFKPKVDPREQWEKEYGKPNPAWSADLSGKAAGMTATMDPQVRKQQYIEERRSMLWQAIRDSLYYTEGPGAHGPNDFWNTAMKSHNRKHAPEVAAFRAELAQHGWDELMAFDWLKAKGAA